ncbi:hypothetical protein HRI_004311000 [Hibiscus trionum]|uniref:RING-type E3 ubiquitin transferase n=1 Tax=Hibiscus trionum TaxID=183268 RepID=A0A9W7J4U4_HIBTR|nr:hypothetical protein HRI_004311000 [Hibiscus trionum]
MASRYYIKIRQEDGSFLDHFGSNIPHRLLLIDLDIRCISSLNPEATFEIFNRSVAGRRDVFLSEENARNTIRSMVADSGITPEFVDTVLVPDILSHARHADSLPVNLGHQVIKLRVEILVEVSFDDEIGELIDESLTSSVNFKPASKSSIETLNRVKYGDNEDEDYLPLKKRRKLGEDLSSRKECGVCLDEFFNGDEITSMPCGHVYHHGCIVEWLETSHMCPLCRYQMPID